MQARTYLDDHHNTSTSYLLFFLADIYIFNDFFCLRHSNKYERNITTNHVFHYSSFAFHDIAITELTSGRRRGREIHARSRLARLHLENGRQDTIRRLAWLLISSVRLIARSAFAFLFARRHDTPTYDQCR
jgi:hypothetical protein